MGVPLYMTLNCTVRSLHSLHIIHTGPRARFAAGGRQAVLKWSYQELVKGSKARWPLPRLMWRSSGTGAARATGRATHHAASYTAETARGQERRHITNPVRNSVLTQRQREKMCYVHTVNFPKSIWEDVNTKLFILETDTFPFPHLQRLLHFYFYSVFFIYFFFAYYLLPVFSFTSPALCRATPFTPAHSWCWLMQCPLQLF
jgi:hypothetical protein